MNIHPIGKIILSPWWVVGIVLTVFPIVLNEAALEKLDGLLPNHPSGGMDILIGIILIPLILLHGFSFIIGTAICFWRAGMFILRLPTRAISPALLIPLLCDGYMFAQSLPFLMVPRGTGIRPMGWEFFTLLLALAATGFGLIFVLIQFRAERSKIVWSVGMLLSLLPIPIAVESLSLMAAIKGFKLEP